MIKGVWVLGSPAHNKFYLFENKTQFNNFVKRLSEDAETKPKDMKLALEQEYGSLYFQEFERD